MNRTVRLLAESVSQEAQSRSAVNVPLLIVLGSLLLTAVFYYSSSAELAELWSDTVRRRYTHGWVVLAVTIGLIWYDRAQLARIELSPPAGGWMLVALGSIVWLVGFNAALLAVTTLVLPLLVLTTIWASGGYELARRAAFPVLFLYFSLPVWEQLFGTQLQILTAHVSLWLIHVLGIPATLQDLVIHIPAGSFLIEERCNGLHFLVVALGIAALQGHVHKDTLGTRLLLLSLAGALALVTNWLRVTLVIVAGHLTDMQHFLVQIDHYYFGWVLFAVGLVLYMFVSSRVPRGESALPVRSEPKPPLSRRHVLTAISLSTAALALGPFWAQVQVALRGGDREQIQPPTLDGWKGPFASESDWRPAFHAADDEYLVRYESGSLGEVLVYVAAYRYQRQGKELLGFDNSLAGRSFEPETSGRRFIVAGGAPASVTENMARRPDGRRVLIWSVYAINGESDPLGLTSRLAYGLRSLSRAPTASVVALAVECGFECDGARDRLELVFPELVPELLNMLPRT